MEIIYEQLLERNVRETIPFLSIYESYTSLLNLTDNLQTKCSAAERELQILRQQLYDGGTSPSTGSVKGTSSAVLNNNTAIQSAMKNETRLREKLETLQEQYTEMAKNEQSTTALLQEAQALNSKNEKMIADLSDAFEGEKNTAERLRQQVKDAEANSNLMDDQNYKLKVAFRTLQDENDKLKKDNLIYEERLVREKGKVVDEMNELTEIIERLKAEVEKLRSQQRSKQHDSTSSSWFGSLGSVSSPKIIENLDADIGSPKARQDDDKTGADIVTVETVPTTIHQTIAAHTIDGTYVRYDHSAYSNMVATASSDGTVKVWDMSTGQRRGTFRCSPGYAITCCDLARTFVVGGGNDRSCRVWDLRNERMVCGS
jgi:Autophagy protein 16 (ATG16)/WD domain, G-beta repeat